MSREIVVLMDVDDVLADLLGSVIEFIREVDGVEYDRDNFTKHEFFAGINRSDLRFLWKTRIDLGGYVSGLNENPGARAAMDHLRSKFIVHPCTAPLYSSTRWMHERATWLVDRMNVPFADQIHTAAKHRCRGDVIVDDRPENLRRFAGTNPGSLLVLFEQPWNRDESGSWKRARTMDDVVSIVEDRWPNR